ncbi:MAG TPA: lipoyl(octanoyl) transferase LipB [Puia sp.]|jgi:lipoyl(octanoyl) transferase|nr:lipoyl(octanoyl) transferase LipB [Puia sp.]
MKEPVLFKDLGKMDYAEAWRYQESLLQENVQIKTRIRSGEPGAGQLSTRHYLLFVEHPPVYTLGKSGHPENVLLNNAEMEARGILFFHTNRGGDITFHGPEQIVGYPILDLEKFGTDIGLYLRNLEEIIIRTLADYGIRGERSKGETGVWIQPGVAGRERKIAAIGVRCSRWITMHGFAFNINTDLSYFDGIIPCGIRNKQVSSMARELGRNMDIADVKAHLKIHFEEVFHASLSAMEPAGSAVPSAV